MKNNLFRNSSALFILTLLLLLGCNNAIEEIKFNYTNSSESDIKNKTIEIDIDKLNKFNYKKLKIFDETHNKELIYQLLDLNKDGKTDQLIFQINIEANSETIIKITQVNKNGNFVSARKVYAKFVPERKDDFAWENDRIAYRMYGPALEATGEISNGIDVWVKSTKNLILDKWYKTEDYHTDHGEGLDYYKVGPSLGCGGSALFENGELNKSKNFVKWSIVANGPIRTIFELEYAPRIYKGSEITEIKIISLDAGQNLNKIEVKYLAEDSNITFQNVIGIVKHKGLDEGITEFIKSKGIFAYWEPTNKQHGNTAIGVVVNPQMIYEIKETDIHYLIILKETMKKSFTYYTGAAWSKSGDFNNFSEWKNYLENYSDTIIKQ
jgi:hypothetical protein